VQLEVSEFSALQICAKSLRLGVRDLPRMPTHARIANVGKREKIAHDTAFRVARIHPEMTNALISACGNRWSKKKPAAG
jgi:hypothetical protein